MSDEFQIPSQFNGANPVGGRAPVSTRYRAHRSPVGLSPVKLAVAGLGGLMLLGAVGWGVMGRRPAVIPVIEADSRPIRIKPENPGGMQFAGADEMTSGDGATGSNRMAPAAETPAPQALRAQMQQAAPELQAVAPQAPTASAPAVPDTGRVAVAPVAPGVGPGVSPSVSPSVSPLPDTPGRAVSRASVPPVSPPSAAVSATLPSSSQPAAPAAKPSGGTVVQLAALGSEAAAQAEWQKLARSMPDLLTARQPIVQKIERDGKTLWRLRTGGFSDIADATGFCGKLHAKGSACTIASF